MIKNAATIAMLYFTLFFCGGLAISIYEELPLLDCLYEAASAVGTVGLTLGITPKLHIFSQVVLIILMYLGACRWSDSDLCGAFRKKQGKCKAASGENNSWIRRRKYNYEECIAYWTWKIWKAYCYSS